MSSIVNGFWCCCVFESWIDERDEEEEEEEEDGNDERDEEEEDGFAWGIAWGIEWWIEWVIELGIEWVIELGIDECVDFTEFDSKECIEEVLLYLSHFPVILFLRVPLGHFLGLS